MRSDHLASRGRRIEDAAGRAHGQHAADPDLAGEAIDAGLDEVSAEGRLLVALVEASPFDLVLGDEFAFADGLGKLGGTVCAPMHLAVRERRLRRVEAEPLRNGFPKLYACRVDARSRTVRAELPSGSGRDGERGIAEPNHDLLRCRRPSSRRRSAR